MASIASAFWLGVGSGGGGAAGACAAAGGAALLSVHAASEATAGSAMAAAAPLRRKSRLLLVGVGTRRSDTRNSPGFEDMEAGWFAACSLDVER